MVGVEEVAEVFTMTAMVVGVVMIHSMEGQITTIRMAVVDRQIEEDLGVGAGIRINNQHMLLLDLIPCRITVATEDTLEVAILVHHRLMADLVMVHRLREVVLRHQTTIRMHVMIPMEVIMDMEGIVAAAVADMVIIKEATVDKVAVAVIAVMAVMAATEVMAVIKAAIHLVITATVTLVMEEPTVKAGVVDEADTINLLTHIVRYM